MEKRYFSLETGENNRFVKFIRIIFGIVCLTVAIFWLIFNIRSTKSDVTLWITIVFLSGFGLYQIWSGLGRANTFMEIGADSIRLKKNPILPTTMMQAREIIKIELFPLNVIFILKSKKIFLRFGTTYPEMIEPAKDAIIEFSSSNNINLEFIKEQL